jgi:hypothetical protein
MRMGYFEHANRLPYCANINIRRSVVPFCAALFGAATGCGANAEMSSDDREMDEAESSLVGGAGAPNRRPEIGAIRGTGGGSNGGDHSTPKCTATLLHPQWVVTTASCFGYGTGTVNETWRPAPVSDVTDADLRQITYAHSAGTTNDAKNIAFGRLSAPSRLAPAAIAAAMPAQGQTVTVFGYGCNAPNTPGNGGFASIEFPFGQTTNFACSSGDEGGPRINTGALGAPPTLLWGLTGQSDGSGIDKVADLVQYGLPYGRGIAALGGTTRRDVALNSIFALTLNQGTNVRPVSGDFNGDGISDIVLAGAHPSAMPVAFGDGNGGFTYTALPHQVPIGTLGAKIVGGDFDGDGDSDLAMLGGTTLRFAFSNRDGTFTFTQEPAGEFSTLAGASGAYVVAADLNGDRVTDLALLGGAGWTTVPILKRRAGGVSEFINPTVANFPAWSRQAGVRGYAARLSTTDVESLILMGLSILTPSVRLSEDGTALTTALSVFPNDTTGWAKVTGTKLVVGDYNGDGRSDFAYVGGLNDPQINHLPFVFSSGASSFTTAFLPLTEFAALGRASLFALPVRRQGSLASDLVLLRTNAPATIVQLRP